MAEAPAVTLPDKPSELLTIALEDLERIEKDGHYVIDMETWHNPDPEVTGSPGTCAVCLAGAVIAERLGVEHTRHSAPDHFSMHTSARLLALDCFRRGHVAMGCDYLNVRLPGVTWISRAIDPYSINPDGFKADLRQLAADLAAAGF